MSGYELSKCWYEFCGDNSEKVNTNHHALFFWIVEKANRLQWITIFGLPSDEAMHYLGINTYKTYIKTFRELVDFGFIEIVSESKNQYTSNKICFGKKYQSTDQSKVESKANALTKAEPTQSEYNKTVKTKELLNIKTLNTLNDFQKNENLVIVENVEVLEISEVVILNTNTEGEKEKEKSSAKKEKETEYPFEIIWEMYGKKVGFARTEKRYEKVKECDRAKIFAHVPKYVASTPDVQFRKNFEVYLNQKSFNDQIIIKNGSSNSNSSRGFKNESGDEYLERVGTGLDAIFAAKFNRNGNQSANGTQNASSRFADFTEL